MDACVSLLDSNQHLVAISQEDCKNKTALNAKLERACRAGFFYLEIPKDCLPLIDDAVRIGNSFYKDTAYTGLQLEGVSGYHDRDEFQVEALYLEKKYWKEKMPLHLSALAEKMHNLGIFILQKTLNICGIEENDWDRASGGAAIGKGQTHFTFNHYRKEKDREGLAEHQDFGQITILFINSKGLRARIANEWVDVMPLKNHFIVNYGRALETLINDPNKLTAAWHCVPKVNEDRISFGTFGDNDNDSTIYTVVNGKLQDTGKPYKTYFDNSFATYYVPQEKK